MRFYLKSTTPYVAMAIDRSILYFNAASSIHAPAFPLSSCMVVRLSWPICLAAFHSFLRHLFGCCSDSGANVTLILGPHAQYLGPMPL